MGFIIIDLEFNNMQNITKYYPNIYNEQSNLRTLSVQNEIIEIGAVKLDKFMKKVGEYKAYIKPSIFKVLNPKITEITGIKEDQLKEGISFEEAMDNLKNFVEKDNIICSWATDDIVEIISNANYHGYKSIHWIKSYLDIQDYCTKMLAHKKALGLKSALEELKIKVDKNKLHDALHDANYASEVFKRLYNGKMVKNYIVNDVYNMPSIRVKDLKNYKAEDIVVDFKCPKCINDVNIEYPLALFNWRFLSMGNCPKCNNKLLQEIILKKTLTGEITYKNIISSIDDMDYMNFAYKFKRISKNRI